MTEGGAGGESAVLACPRCAATYLPTVTICADCGVVLRDPSEPGAEDEVAYELEDWTPEQRRTAGRQLDAEGVAWRFEGDELVVAEADADVVEEVLDVIDNPDSLPIEDGDETEGDDGAAELLSVLYVASDVLVNDPDNSAAVVELLEAAESAASASLPYGLDGAVWAEVLRDSEAVADLLGEGSREEDVVVAARRLRDTLRPLV
ncbi:MAG: hypothetical protein M3R01_00635 [Actinomycetota bacterium]|nr:hypothetical protein [Actinomycetota bacterium]